MKSITIYDANDNNIEVEVLNGTTLTELCDLRAVKEFFDIYESNDIAEELYTMNGNAIPAFLRSTVISSLVEDGATYGFDLDAVGSYDEDEDDEDEGEDEEVGATVPEAIANMGRRGVVTVETSAGLQSTNIAITIGETTVHEAIYTDAVKARSGMTDAQLSSCIIVLNEDEISQDESHDKTLTGGDVICLNNRAVSTKAGR